MCDDDGGVKIETAILGRSGRWGLRTDTARAVAGVSPDAAPGAASAATPIPGLTAAPAAQPWALGIAVGALLQLVLDELLPESYHQAGHTSIALVALLAMGMVVGLAGVAP